MEIATTAVQEKRQRLESIYGVGGRYICVAFMAHAENRSNPDAVQEKISLAHVPCADGQYDGSEDPEKNSQCQQHPKVKPP